MIAITHAKIGRSMKNFATRYFRAGCGRLHGAGCCGRGSPSARAPSSPAPGRTFCRPSTITCSPAASPLGDQPRVADRAIGDELAALDLVRLVDDERDRLAVLIAGDRALRHEDRLRLACPPRCARARTCRAAARRWGWERSRAARPSRSSRSTRDVGELQRARRSEYSRPSSSTTRHLRLAVGASSARRSRARGAAAAPRRSTT